MAYNNQGTNFVLSSNESFTKMSQMNLNLTNIQQVIYT